MLKIDFFPPEITKEYEDDIAKKVKTRNNGNDEIEFIPRKIAVSKSGNPYKIKIKDLLTLQRDEILAIDGIKLYMLICSSQKYSSSSNPELLYTLHSEYPNAVTQSEHKRGCYMYTINGVKYQSAHVNDNSKHIIIDEVVTLIKNEISKYDTNYANHYFNNNNNIQDINSLNNVLKNMFDDLNAILINGRGVSIIDYSIVSSSKIRHTLLNSVGIRTCPYCNRNYITAYGKGKKSTADLDHFYQKKKYPLFALSLFNFIPSCQICNSRMKNTHSADNTLYPYKEGFENDAHFELKYTGKSVGGSGTLKLWQAIKDINYSDYKIKIIIDPFTDPEKRKRIENSNKLFRIEDVYEDHKLEALEAALRTRIYCEGSYKTFNENLFKNLKRSGMRNTSVSDLESCLFWEGFDNEWLMFGLFMNDEKRKYDKPLSRMISDIYHLKG